MKELNFSSDMLQNSECAPAYDNQSSCFVTEKLLHSREMLRIIKNQFESEDVSLLSGSVSDHSAALTAPLSPVVH